MPNYVENRIRLDGDSARIHAMLEAIRNDEIGTGSVDFNKIIPMPESLNIEAGSRTDRGMKAYRDFIQEYAPGSAEKARQTITEEAETAYLLQRKDISQEEWILGRTAWNNLRQYGAPTWYEWCIQHWGTKWNACGYEENEAYFDGESLSFQTAWSAPHVIVRQLARQFPEITFTHQWADEDIGQNCGKRIYQDGRQTEEYLPDNQKEAVAFACGLWGYDPADLELSDDNEHPEPELTLG